MTSFVNEFGFHEGAASYRAVVSADVKGGQGFRVAGFVGDGGLLAAIKADGLTDWQKQYLVAGRTVRFFSGVRCDDGDLMLHGSLQGSSANQNESMIVRVSASGDVRWAKSYTQDKTRYNIQLVKGTGDTYFFAGWYNESGSVDDIEVVKIDGAGTVLGAVNIHSDGDDQLNSIIPYNDGCILVGLTSWSGWSGFIVALDGDLRIVWKKVIGDSDFQEIRAILQLGPKEFVITGETGPNRQTFMAPFSTSDSSVTALVYSFKTGQEHGTKRLIKPGASNVYLAATAEGAPLKSFVVCFDRNLQVLWQRSLTLPDENALYDIVDSHDGIRGLAVCGMVSVSGATSNRVALLAYTDLYFGSCVTTEREPKKPTSVAFRVQAWTSAAATKVALKVTTHALRVLSLAPILKEICGTTTEVDLKDARVQSPYIYLQASGSDFSDETVGGIQLRWDLLRRLGDTHLPKGNLAAPGGPWPTNIGFNRADDFVRIFRTELKSDYGVTVFFQLPPSSLFESGVAREWLYEDLVPSAGRTTDVSIRFVDVAQYDTLRSTIDPRAAPIQFIAAYTGILEARTVGKLAFLARFDLNGTSTVQQLRVEAVTLPDRLDNASRMLGCRRVFTQATNAPIVCENIETLRFDYAGLFPITLHIATHEDFLFATNERREWRSVGEYSLDDGNADANAKVFRRLEDPPSFSIDGVWPMFRRVPAPGVFRVKAQNYRDRWLMADGLKDGVTRYLDASRTDVKASVVVASSDPVANDSAMELSYLDLLNFVSLDYHVARMLGLGTIDTNAAVDTDTQFVYMMRYVTEGRLEHETPARVTHCYLTPPVRINDYKLPPQPVIGLSYGLPPEECEGTTTSLTDPAGYALYEDARFINLLRAPFRHELPMPSFFETSEEFCLCEETVPVAFGVTYGPGPIGAANLEPELANNPEWRDSAGLEETSLVPDRGNPVYTHNERFAGVHHYGAYSINWFSRSSAPSNDVQTDATHFEPRNTLLPPSNFAVQLIQKEEPRILTSLDEQLRLGLMPAGDKTLVRVTFDWNHIQNRPYFFADKVELYFRTAPLAVIRGKVLLVTENSTAHTATITTAPYFIGSTALLLTVQPNIAAADVQRFIGGRLAIDGQAWVIRSVSSPGLNPTLVVEQIRTTASVDADQNNSFCTVEMWHSPKAGDRFLIAENLNHPNVWDTRLAKEVSLVQFSPPYSEITITANGFPRTEILGGLSDSATVQEVPDPDLNIGAFVPAGGPSSVPSGAWCVTFASQQLPSPADPAVEFHEGILRMPDVNGQMKALRVWNIDTTASTLKLLVYDSEHALQRDSAGMFVLDGSKHFVPVDGYVPVRTGIVSIVNFHPSYRVYLTADLAGTHNFGETAILPAENERSRQTLMTARALDTRLTPPLASAMARPAVLLALEIREPEPPGPPLGPLYATRPNFYGKATYTFDVRVDRPQSLVFYKANDRKVLDQLYGPATVRNILAQLDALSGFENDFATQRWSDLVHVKTGPGDEFIAHVASGFRFPIPDNDEYVIPDPRPNPPSVVRPFQSNTIPPGSSTHVPGTTQPMKDVVRNAIEEAFVPLTELPLVYRLLRDTTLQTSGRPPKVRNPNGERLSPDDPQYDPWPMAVRYEKNGNGEILLSGDPGYGAANNTRWVRITDYTLDGAATDRYFYFAVELTDALQVSARSGIAGPVTLVNSSPPVAPAIRDVHVRTANGALELPAAVVFEVNPYLVADRVVSFRIYRAMDATSAQNVRSMTLARTVPAGGELVDDFADADVVPFGDPLFYRIVAMRSFTNEEGVEELAPSFPSEMRRVQLIDDVVPPAPDLAFTIGTPLTGPPVLFPDVNLTWNRTAWKPRYHVFKMNALGNWVKVHTLETNDPHVTLDLATTDLGTNVLPKQNAAGKTIYHRFKVVTENSGGLLSKEEKPLVI